MIESYFKADLHVHTTASYDGFATPEEVLMYAEHHTELDFVAITDHNQIFGAQEAQRLSREKNTRVQIIIGEEINTTGGEVIGLFLQEKIEPMLSLVETIDVIHRQGGLAIIPHPWRSIINRKFGRWGVPYKTILKLLKKGVRIDGVETYNASIFGRLSHRKIRKKLSGIDAAFTGGSDAHLAKNIGHMYTCFHGDLYQALFEHQTWAEGNFTPIRGYIHKESAKNFMKTCFRSLQHGKLRSKVDRETLL